MGKVKDLPPDEVRKGQENIKNKIYEQAKELGLSKEGIEPVPDGVFHIEGYCLSSPRIMWILKQPYDDIKDGKPTGGGWEVFGAFENSDAHTNMTWQPIVYSLVGIREHKLYKDMPYIREDKSMLEKLKDIAYINVDKMPGRKTTSSKELAQAYSQWKDIIEEQVRLYDPQVICFANTMWLFKNDWGFDEHTEHESVSLGNDKYMQVYHKDGRLCLDTYHPSQRIVSRENYIDAIIKTVNNHFNK